MNAEHTTLSKRQETLISCLLGGEAWLTSERLAVILGVSQRTVKEEIKRIKSIEHKIGIRIRAQIGRGYIADVENAHLFHCYNNRINTLDLNTQNDRILVLIQTLLIQQDFIILDDLADSMNISLSTLHNDMKLARPMLLEEEIDIVSRPNRGIKVSSSERKIRATLSKYINLDLFSIASYNRLFKDSTFTYADMKLLAEYFVELLRDYYHNLIGLGITNLLIHLIIIINRNKAGFKIEHLHSECLTNRREYQFALDIANFLHDKFAISLPDKEIQYLSFCLLHNGVVNMESNLVGDFLSQVYLNLKTTFNVQLDEQHDSYNALYLHTMGILERLKYGLDVDGAGIIGMVRKRFVLAYEMAMIYKDGFVRAFSCELDDVEVCYVAVHFGAMLESQKLQRNLPKLIIITEARTGKALLLKNEVLSRFGTMINVCGIYSPYEMNRIDFSQIDFILSTENLGDAFGKQYLKIPFNLSAATLRKIKTYLYNQKIIDRIFKETLFFRNHPFSDASEFLSYSTRQFKMQNFIENAQEFYELTYKREMMQSTRFDYVLALPHPLRAISKENFISVAVFEEGLRWFNGDLVKLVLYVGFTGKNKEEITSIFDILSRISSSHTLIDKLIQTKTFDAFISALKQQLNVSDGAE